MSSSHKESRLKDARKFLETTEDIFSSVNGFIDTLLNDFSSGERELLYRSSPVRHLSDETVESYRRFIKSLSETCNRDDHSPEGRLQLAKNLIASNQSTIEQLAGLLDNRSELFFGAEMDELKEWVECFIQTKPN